MKLDKLLGEVPGSAIRFAENRTQNVAEILIIIESVYGTMNNHHFRLTPEQFNLLLMEFTTRFCEDDGRIDWPSLIDAARRARL